MRIRSSYVILLLLIATASQAAPRVLLERGMEKRDLGLYVDILEDKKGDLTIEQVSSETYSGKWVQNKKTQPNFAFSHSAYWMRIILVSEMKTPKTFWFEVAFALHHNII